MKLHAFWLRLIFSLAAAAVLAGPAAFARAAAPQVQDSGIETCDSSQLPSWNGSEMVSIQDDACALDPSARLSYRGPLLDFRFTFDALLPEDGRLIVRLSWFIDHWVEIALTPAEASVTEFTGSGSASSTVREQKVGGARVSLDPGRFHRLTITHQKRALVIETGGETVLAVPVSALRSGPALSVSKGMLLDNLQVEALPLMQPGESLASLSAGLLESSIAFRGEDGALWWVLPNGSAVVKTEPEIHPGEMKFSPAGDLLAVDDSGLIRVVDSGDKTVLPAWRESSLKRGPFHWTSDGLLLVASDAAPLSIDEIDPLAAKAVHTHTLPASLDASGFIPARITRLNASPDARVVHLELIGALEGSSVTRHVLFDLDSGAAAVFPGSASSRWQPLGARITIPGGYLEYPSMAVREMPGMERLFSSFSPNGQFAARPGSRVFEESIVDLESGREIASIPGQVSWASDSRHIVYSDNGRIAVQNVLDPQYLQIAAGTGPQWQPSPALAVPAAGMEETATPAPSPSASPAAASSPTRTPRATSTPRPAVSSNPTAALLTTTPTLTPGAVDAAAPRGPSSPLLPILMLVIGLASSGAGAAALLRAPKRICPICGRVNRMESLFCPFCTTSLKEVPPVRQNRPVVYTMTAAGLVLAVSGAAILAAMLPSLAAQPPQPAASEAAAPAPSPGVERLNRPAAGREDGCASYDITGATLREMYNAVAASDDRRIAQAGETQAAEQAASAVPGYLLHDPLFSPDGQRVLVPYSDPLSIQYWNAVYETGAYTPLWVKPMNFAMKQALWSPDGSRLAARSGSRWIIYDASSGEQVGAIPDSTRSLGWCTDPNNASNIRWLPDSRHLLRKIYNAVQVLNSDTGELVRETPVDDTRMGGHNPEPGSMLCSHNLFWSPDGSAFITTADFPGPDGQAYLVRKWDTATGKLLWDRQAAARAGMQSWSPDGSRFLYSLTGQITLFDASTGEPVDFPAAGISPSQPAFWSPGSSSLAFTGETKGEIVLLDLASAETQRLTAPTAAPLEILAWLADGRLLVKAQLEPARSPVYWLVNPEANDWKSLGDD